MANTAKLLLIQGGRCFYCREPLALDKATLEHVIPKAQGGDSSEDNTVACCADINHLLGNASAKEKLSAVLNAGGVLRRPKSKQVDSPVIPVKAEKVAPQQPKQHLSIETLKVPMKKAFEQAAAMHQGRKATLSALGTELRKREEVSQFSTKQYGHKLFGDLVKELGYQVEGQWVYLNKQSSSI